MKAVIRRHISVVNSLIVLLSSLTLVIGGYFGLTSPVAFQKSNAIKAVDSLSKLSATNAKLLDVRLAISSIPYKLEGGPVNDVKPVDKYRKTIEEGKGNCSNMSFGMSYRLIQEDIDFQIVQILNPVGFLEGNGHTVLNVPYHLDGEARVGIVDMVEGGVPMNGSDFIDIEDLQRGGLSDFKVKPLNASKDLTSPYYDDLVDQGVIGVIDRDEVEGYFRFLSTVYIPLGNKRLEKMFYDGVSMVLGVFPTIYVDRSDYDLLFSKYPVRRFSAICLLWSIRGLAILLIYRILFATVVSLSNYGRDRRNVAVAN